MVVTLSSKAYHSHDSIGVYRPFYLVVLFDTWNARRLRFELPSLATGDEIDRFISLPVLALLDEHDMPVNAAYGRLPVSSAEVAAALHHHDGQYSGGVPQRAGPRRGQPAAAQLAGDDTAGQIEQMLRFWFLPSGIGAPFRWLEWTRRHCEAEHLMVCSESEFQ
ncbi:hypothetical protein ABK905_09055 [Acerihabitans sp. KWT182]|uniref:DUF4365 domain-containing protein n=1 Tax=Acerihabitans sp. KWT182 TaxID=3157919 RepID=A0AAU7QFN5_9GAMM